MLQNRSKMGPRGAQMAPQRVRNSIFRNKRSQLGATEKVKRAPGALRESPGAKKRENDLFFEVFLESFFVFFQRLDFSLKNMFFHGSHSFSSVLMVFGGSGSVLEVPRTVKTRKKWFLEGPKNEKQKKQKNSKKK